MEANFADRARAFAPPAWEQLPDLGLYMDQVITYLERQYQGLYGDARRAVTPAMINNYVKAGLMARPVGKKYEREQIAQLIMLCTLKQAVSLEELRRLMAAPRDGGVEAVYRQFCGLQRDTLQSLVDEIGTATPMQCAVKAAAYQLLCEEILPPAPKPVPEGKRR